MQSLFIGLMSGTSLDAIDAVVVDFSQPRPRLIASHAQTLESDLRDDIRTLAEGGHAEEIELLGRVDRRLGHAFATSVETLLAEAGLTAADIQAIGSHGQTVRHRPRAEPAFTLQIGDPNTIAEQTGITTVADFRRRDIAAGGEGAPLVPAFHASAFHSKQEYRAVLNLGGMANLTLLPASAAAPVSGFDTGPGNVLMDAWIHHCRGELLDRDGAWARSGKVMERLLDRLLGAPYLDREPPKSTGREDFNLAWLQHQLGQSKAPPEDVQATLLAFTVESVARSLARWAPDTKRLLVCGGGAGNGALMQTLQERLGTVPVESTRAFGVDPDWVEATAFAWFAQQTLAGKASNVCSVTGARHPCVLGGIYPA